MVFIRVLTEAARSILLLCLLDLYWSSVGPLNMKLMVGRGSDGCSMPTIALFAAGQFLFHGPAPECTF